MWTEYVNRLLGVTVGFLILGTVISAWRHYRRDPKILWTSVVALLLTGFEGWLGGRVVAHELAAWIVTIHLIVALVIVQLLLYATVRATSGPGAGTSSMLTLPLVVLIAVTVAQIVLGTQVRGRVDAALDTGVARTAALSTVGRLDSLHRSSALLVFGGCLILVTWISTRFPAEARLARWSYIVAALATAQVALGVVMAYVSLQPAAQVAHLTIASLLLGAETVLWLHSPAARQE